MEPPERVAATPQLPADADESHSVGQTPINQLGTVSRSCASQDQKQARLETDGWELQQMWSHSLQPEFQDSNLSPALTLLPVNPGVEHMFSEYSLFQQSDNEFAPLRPYPDISMASERFHFPPQDRTTQASERGSLSQHPLAQEGEGENSCCSLSQHSLSPGDEGRRKETIHSPLTAITDGQGLPSRDNTGCSKKDSEPVNDPPDKPVRENSEDEAFFLNKEIPAQHLLELLQKDMDMPSGSSSTVSSASETSVKIAASFSEELKSSQVCKSGTEQSTVRREGPPGQDSFPQQQTQQPDRDLCPDQSQTLSSQVSNITTGLRSTQPDDSSEVLHRELLYEVQRRSSCEVEYKKQQQKIPTPPGQSVTLHPTQTSEEKPSVSRTNLHGVPWTGPFSAGVELREQDLWSSGNQTGIDGSYLGFLPQSQSTPGVFKAPPKSSVKAKLEQLSPIDSNKDTSSQSNTGISPQPADVHEADVSNQFQEESTSAKVQFLPSLSYMQKVDAWRANQISGKTSLFDSLALQGFSGVSPKKKAYDAVSDTLNRILTQQAKSLQQPPVSVASQNVTQSFSTAPSGSSSFRREEAVGSAPTDRDNTGSATGPSASSFNRSQSHSSLSTVVMSVKKDQQTERCAARESPTQDDIHHQPSATAQPLPLVSIGQFSDVSPDQDLTLSSSQNSHSSGIKLGTSIGASSVVSLEVDNYAPYWTSKLSTPPPQPRPRELNIEERIPLYLHNLGIDQSPSTILTPFAPRGPIREPEFSPTDLCTIKGSIGTPTKSTQPSEGGSPHKGEFSRSSILSVDSSISIPFSLDSLGPAASIPERTRRASPSSDTEAMQSECSLASFPQPDEDSYSSTLQTTLQQQRKSSVTSSQNTIQLGDGFDSDLLLATETRDLESPLRTSHSMEENTETSFVSSKALLEIHKLLSQTENVASAGSSLASSASPAAPRLLSDEDIFLSLRKKTSRLHDSSFSSSSATGDPRNHSSLLWARSSSDSMLTSEKLRESSLGQETMTSLGKPNYPSIQPLITAPTTGAYIRPQNSTVGRGAGSSFVLSQSARRSEPEGCSAAPPDNTVPPQPPVIKPSSVLTTQQLTSASGDVAGVTEEEKQTNMEGPVQSSSSSPILEDTDQGVMSDGSSESSLAVRVAKLLQSESSATMVSSTPSSTDQEESKAREWIKLKISGQQCEPLELDKEDRRRIEEIKRELLLRNPIKSQGSTDTESSAASSIAVLKGQDPTQQAEIFTALRDANNQQSQVLRGLSTDLCASSMELQNPPRPDLEAQIREIAAKEGVTLPSTNPRALTSITIATRRRSTSFSPSTSPAPPLSPAPELLHLTEHSIGAINHPKANQQLTPTRDEEDKTTTEPASLFEPSSLYTRNQNLISQAASAVQTREDAVGGQFEEPPPPLLGLDRQQDNKTHSLRHDGWLSVRDSSVSGIAHEAEQATGSSTAESPARSGHVSHVHLTLSPKATNHSLATALHTSHMDAVVGLPRKEFVPLRHSSSAGSSPDEGVGSSSPPEWYNNREPIRQGVPERADACSLFKTAVPQGRMTSTSSQSFIPYHRAVVSLRARTTESPALPVLLPYKPPGSEELFYVPQTEANFSSTESSHTTMESTHTGSDDAVPPRFSSEDLGHGDPGLDRGVTIRHTEGIYSKRLKTATFKMHKPEHRGASVSAGQTSQTSVSSAPKQASQVSVAFTRVPLSSDQEAFEKDQGTSPVQFLSYDQPEPSHERFQHVHVGMDYEKASHHLDQSSVLQAGGERDQDRWDRCLPQQNSSTLDQLWERFCARWSLVESQPTSDREASLLERLERLSRLIHSTKGTKASEAYRDPEEKLGRRGKDATGNERKKHTGEVKMSTGDEAREVEWRVRGGRKVDGEPPIPRQAWTKRLQVEETSQPADKGSFTSGFSHDTSQSLCPADRDESETLSTTSGSISTVDTARLVRAFGPHRVQHLKTSTSLRKLYSTINTQKEGREQRRGRNKELLHIITLSETTDESTVAADSASSTSTYTLPSQHGPSRTLVAKKPVKLVSKGIQAGDLELVCNGTRRHTRDVGTTFPSPGEARTSRQISSSSSSLERGKGDWRSPSKTQALQKQRKTKRSPSKTYLEGVSWFISADELRSEARKENRPEEEDLPGRQSTAWFEPYSRIKPWREPLRQRQVPEDGNKQHNVTHHAEPDVEPRTKTMFSGLACMSLQEALATRRPEFISQSRQRVKRLALQTEERKLQEVFSREREELFSRPEGPGRLLKPAGTVVLRRAVPRKEMIQRSKQIYDNLPEVQRRREKERRKAEYRSYRLNAQLYNKRITSRVLGRRAAWQ